MGLYPETPIQREYIKSEHRLYLHIYFSGERAVEDEHRFTNQLLMLQKELLSGERKPAYSKLCGKYFEIHTTQAIFTDSVRVNVLKTR